MASTVLKSDPLHENVEDCTTIDQQMDTLSQLQHRQEVQASLNSSPAMVHQETMGELSNDTKDLPSSESTTNLQQDVVVIQCTLQKPSGDHLEQGRVSNSPDSFEDLTTEASTIQQESSINETRCELPTEAFEAPVQHQLESSDCKTVASVMLPDDQDVKESNSSEEAVILAISPLLSCSIQSDDPQVTTETQNEDEKVERPADENCTTEEVQNEREPVTSYVVECNLSKEAQKEHHICESLPDEAEIEKVNPAVENHFDGDNLEEIQQENLSTDKQQEAAHVTDQFQKGHQSVECLPMELHVVEEILHPNIESQTDELPDDEKVQAKLQNDRNDHLDAHTVEETEQQHQIVDSSVGGTTNSAMLHTENVSAGEEDATQVQSSSAQKVPNKLNETVDEKEAMPEAKCDEETTKMTFVSILDAQSESDKVPTEKKEIRDVLEEENAKQEEQHKQPEEEEQQKPDFVQVPPIVIEEPKLTVVVDESVKKQEIASFGASPTVPARRRSIVQPPMISPSVPPRRRSTMLHASNTSLSRASTPTRLNMPRSPLVNKEASKPTKKKSMFSWLGGDSSKKKNKEVLETVSEGLRKIYKQKLYPLEDHYKFHEFHSPALDDPDFDAKPMILLVGQYSTGKTTFIRHLLEKDFPGIRIGPEPTTDRFIAVMYGEEEGVIPGNALVVDAKKQFRALSGFGNAFLNRFQCSSLPNQVLESVTIVDTPGILSGEKQRIDRGYDFTGVLEWFAERVDRIILLFDAHKLDISDEFKRCIEALSGNEDKIRIVLNKSDMVDHQQLMRVYGALMWSLGKVFRTPEVARVYIGSFWDQPLHYDINRRLFQDEQQDLFQDLQALPRNAALRKLNDLIKRARLAKVHAYIIAELRKQMPSMIGKDKKKKELIQNLDKIFEQLQREHNISPGDFPDVNKMREKLQNQDFTKFNPIKPKLLEVVDGMLATDIARLMAQIPKEEQALTTVNGGVVEQPTVRGGAFSNAQETETPFGFGKGEGFDKGADENEWVVSRERSVADSTFNSLGPVNGYLSGRVAKEHMVKSKLPNAVLGKIWKLADVDRDGQLDEDEFALANYLINLKLEGHELPLDLPAHLVPPSKRNADAVYPTLEDE